MTKPKTRPKVMQSQCDFVEIDEELSIANVNKRKVRTRSSSKPNDCDQPKDSRAAKITNQKVKETAVTQKRKAADNIMFDEMSESAANGSHKKAKSSSKTQRSKDGSNVQKGASTARITEAQFTEGEHLMKMRVEDEDDSLFLTDPLEGEPLAEGSSDEEDEQSIHSNDGNQTELDYEDDTPEQHVPPIQTPKKYTTKQTLQEIDEEMKEKWRNWKN